MMTSPAPSTAIEPLKVVTLAPIAAPDTSPCATTVGLAGLLTSSLNQWSSGTLDPTGFTSDRP
jgi:hypothetical protein